MAQTVGNNFILRGQAGYGRPLKTPLHRLHQQPARSVFCHFVQNAAVHNRLKTAGIDDQIRFAADFAMTVMAVTRQAGQVMHERVFGARQTVE